MTFIIGRKNANVVTEANIKNSWVELGVVVHNKPSLRRSKQDFLEFKAILEY